MVLAVEREVTTRLVLDEITSKTPSLREYIKIMTATAREAREVEEIGNRRRIVTHDGWIVYQDIAAQKRLEVSQELPHIETWGDQEVEVQGLEVMNYSWPKLILRVCIGDGIYVTKPGVIRPALDHSGKLKEFLTILHLRNNINNTTEY